MIGYVGVPGSRPCHPTAQVRRPHARVFEGQQLGIGLAARLVVEDDVVVAVAVEGRVEVDQVDAGVGQVAERDVEVVARVEGVGPQLGYRSASPLPYRLPGVIA